MGKTIGLACNISTGKLDANQAVPGGEYPFFTCAELPEQIDHFTYDDDVVLVAGNNARGNFHVSRYKGKFNAYQRTYILSAKEGYDIDYVYYALKLELKRLREKSQGSQTKFLTMPILTGIELRDITGDEQTEIANVLSAIDKKVELNKRINTELEAMAKTFYDYWFVQFDFPDANGKPYKASGGKMVYNDVLKREIPDGWYNGCTSNIFSLNPTTSLSKGSIAKYIDMNSLPVKGFMTKRPKEKVFAGGTKFIKNDVAVARITPCLENGKTALLSRLEEGEVGFGSTEFIILRGKDFSLFGLASCLSRSESFRQFAIANMTGTSGRKRVDAKVLETYSLAIPPKDLLSKFEETVSSLFEKMTANSVENDDLSDLRDWLLPMLMNGQVTVKPSSEPKKA